MKQSVYNYILNIKNQIGSAICEKLEEKFSDKTKDKLLDILSKLGNEEHYHIIYEYVKNNPNSRDAISALARYKIDKTLNFLLNRLNNTHSLHRDLIVEKLGELKLPNMVKYIKPYLADIDRQVRFQAAYALYNIGNKEAALAMCEYITDPDEWISMTILRLLCKMKQIDTIPILIEKYNADSDLRRKAQMVSFLSRFNSVTLLGLFDEALKSNDARLRANAVEAIGNLKLPEEELNKRVLPYLKDPNNRIRANAILAIAKTSPEKVREQIIEMVVSDDVQLRRSAAFILCMIPVDGYLSQAERLIEDSNETVRKRMIQSLKNFPSEFISANINKVLSDPNKWIRKYAIDMLTTIKGVDSTPIINLLKKEQAAPNIEACLNFLTSHPTEAALTNLKYHYKDRRLEVVRGLLKSLMAIGGLESVKSVAPRLEHRDPCVIQILTDTMLSAGDLDTLDNFISRFKNTKRQYNIDLLLPSLETVVNILSLGDKMPSRLIDSLSRLCVDDASDELLSNLELTKNDEFLKFNETDSLTLYKQEEKDGEPKKKKRKLVFYRAGIKAYNLGKYKKAIEQFRKSINSDEQPPDNVDLYLGIMLSNNGEYDESIKYLLSFLEHSPDNAKASYFLGRCYKKIKDWDNLIRIYKPFMQGKIEANSEIMKKRIQQDMGIACAVVGKTTQAIKMLRAIIKIDSYNAEAYYYLAMALYKNNEKNEAATVISKAEKYAPEGKALSKHIKQLSRAIQNNENI